MAAVLGVSCAVMCYSAQIGFEGAFYDSFADSGKAARRNHDKRQYLSSDRPVELELCRADSITLLQDGPMTRLQKVLAAMGIF